MLVSSNTYQQCVVVQFYKFLSFFITQSRQRLIWPHLFKFIFLFSRKQNSNEHDQSSTEKGSIWGDLKSFSDKIINFWKKFWWISSAPWCESWIGLFSFVGQIWCRQLMTNLLIQLIFTTCVLLFCKVICDNFNSPNSKTRKISLLQRAPGASNGFQFFLF